MKVTLDISGDTKITNGKIRVTYDSSQLKLVSTEAGSMMNGVLTDINDPVSGNKSEGEKQCLYLHPLQNWIQTEPF